MDVIEKNISEFVENQFPEIYREEGPIFIRFVRTYFEWMESKGNPLYHSRNFLEYRDIDETPDEFLVYFKEMYLKGISIESSAGTRLLVKHSLDLYRSKGTEQGLDLLFRAEYGSPATVYYPSTDIFKTSQGKWNQPKYIQVTLNDKLDFFQNKEVIGLNSKATAFVEKSVRKMVKGALSDVLYISAINGKFQVGEKITLHDNTLPISNCPSIVGSVNTFDVDVTGSGLGFVVGDEVVIVSNTGEEGLARVSNIINQTGTVAFEVSDGGYGFSANSRILISDHSLNLTNVVVTGNSYMFPLTTANQAYGTINYVLANGEFKVGDNIKTYYSNGTATANLMVLDVEMVNTTSGTVTFSKMSGNVVGNYISSNVVAANIAVPNGVNEKLATGTMVGISDIIYLKMYNTDLNSFNVGDILTQVDVSNIVTGQATIKYIFNDTNEIAITSVNGVFKNTLPLTSTSGSIGYIIYQRLSMGVVNTITEWISYPGNKISTEAFTGEVTFVSEGAGAAFTINAASLAYTETIIINTDYLYDYRNVKLSADGYGFPKLPTANVTTKLYNALSYPNTVVGRISQLFNINPGKNYNAKPFVYIYEPLLRTMYKRSKLDLTITNSTQQFTPGEVITSVTKDARGLVLSSNSTVLTVENMRTFANNDFTINAVIIGTTSGGQATITNIDIDTANTYEGSDSVILTKFSSGNGAVTGLSPISSGFNFFESEEVTFYKNDSSVGSAIVHLGGVGTSKGYYQTQDSFTSNRNKIRDGNYYQEYSYDVISSISYDKYKNLLKQIMHVAGTKNFFTFVYKNNINSSLAISKVSLVKT